MTMETINADRMTHIDKATLAISQATAILDLLGNSIDEAHAHQEVLGGVQELLAQARAAVAAIRP
jgi:hypothetical protein